jgi:hypothetical protein
MKIPKTIEEAKSIVADLYIEYRDVLKKHNAEGGYGATMAVGDTPTPANIELSEEAEREIQFAQKKMESFSLSCYSLPWLHKEMKAWMVDVKFGSENPFSDVKCCGDDIESLEEMDKKLDMLMEDPEAFTEQSGGSIMKRVGDFIKSEGFKITDRGGGGSGGHIGCPCTDAEMERLLTLLHINFKKAIDAKLIFPKIAWFKPKLFSNDDAIEKWISKNRDI